MKFNKPTSSTTCLAIFFLYFVLVVSVEAEDEEFSYLKGSPKGPEHWGELRKEWAACGNGNGNGNQQSPIDLSDGKSELANNLGELSRSYKPSTAKIVNMGHAIMVQWVNGAGTLSVNGIEYILRQCHWHCPSEHIIHGQRYDAELHIVHESSDGQRAVVAILYKIGQPDTFISELAGHIRNIANKKNAEDELGMVDPMHIQIETDEYYRYNGSLTTPPCTECVVWMIMRKESTVSSDQVNLIEDALVEGFVMNARPTQPRNGRVVQIYSKNDSSVDSSWIE